MASIPPSSSPPNVPPPIPSPSAPGTNGKDDKLTTGEFAALQVEAKKEDARRSPASHWDLVKSTVAIIGTLAGIVLGFVAFGDRVVARAEGKTTDGVKSVKDDLIRHIEDEARHHEAVANALKDFTTEMKEQRTDIKALYRAMPSRRIQSRLELDVVEPDEAEVRALGITGPVSKSHSDAGR